MPLFFELTYLSLAIMPALIGQPMRAYPLRAVNEPHMYVLGEKAGQKVYASQQQSHATGMPTALGAVPTAMQHQAALLAAQSREMEALERRQGRDRNANMAGVRLFSATKDVAYRLPLACPSTR